MARKRMISHDIWGDEKFSVLQPLAKLIFIFCISDGDDEGRLRCDPAYIRGAAFYHHQRISSKVIEDSLHALEDQQMICRYEINGQHYAHLPNWFKHQTISHLTLSRLPACPKCANSGKSPENSRNAPQISGPSQVKSGQVRSREEKIEEVKLIQGAGAETHAGEVTPAAAEHDPKTFSSSLTDLDHDDPAANAGDQDYYAKMPADELASKFAGLTNNGRTKRASGPNAFGIISQICEGFFRGEIVEGWPRLEHECSKDPNAVSDLVAYFEKTLLNMRCEGKFRKSARARR